MHPANGDVVALAELGDAHDPADTPLRREPASENEEQRQRQIDQLMHPPLCCLIEAVVSPRDLSQGGEAIFVDPAKELRVTLTKQTFDAAICVCPGPEEGGV